MDERLAQLLRLVVEDVVETGEPAGSQRLVEAHKLDVSPATVRNWFAELEAQGYIAQPHTSSGRVPTEKGYQMYVTELMQREPLLRKEKAELERIISTSTDSATRTKAVSKMMAELAETAIVAGTGQADTYYTGLSQLFAQPEFRDWQRMVTFGEVLDRMDDVLIGIRSATFDEPTALIGRQCPFGTACSSVVVTLHDGSLLGILGPMRLNYRHSFALLETARELLNPNV
ncbi:hypothetical protein KBC59_04855 [Patescibacteria group bacterium]|jgi:heat-inducible transcriptional repressor|nr:hypothetical protein [Patescibacteria group bacterium]